jgi:nucleotide-binding universal stress UspA family protein
MVLVPLDGTAGSEAALPAVATLARARGATVRLLRIVESVGELRGTDDQVAVYADQESARVENKALDYLYAVAARLLPGVAVEQAVRVGDVPAGIVAEAEAAGADLIAITSHRRGRLGRLIKSSVAHRVQQATTIPLLLTPYGDVGPARPTAAAAGRMLTR